jgi:RNA polymerase sigma factor (sigma-70 family)
MLCHAASCVRSNDVVNGFDQYLHEIAAHALLTPDDEVRLAQTIERGRRAADDLATRTDLDDGERRRCRVAVRRADTARGEFVTANLRLVVSIARHFHVSGLDVDDLVQEGNIGLMRAVERFDWRLGYRFSTYATWWVRQAILRAIATKGRAVRLPSQRLAQLRALARANEELAAALRRVPTTEEVAARLGCDVEQVRDLEAIAEVPASLSTLVGDGDTELGDRLPDTTEATPEALLVESFEHDALERLVHTLPERSAFVLRMHYGLDGESPTTLDEIAHRLGITRERVRQIEQRALLHLRNDVSDRLAVA